MEGNRLATNVYFCTGRCLLHVIFFFLEILAAPHAVAVDPKMDLVLD
jgi:hypothetical protein